MILWGIVGRIFVLWLLKWEYYFPINYFENSEKSFAFSLQIFNFLVCSGVGHMANETPYSSINELVAWSLGADLRIYGKFMLEEKN